MGIEVVGGIIATVIMLLLASFGLGKSSGKKSSKIDNLEETLELREKYIEIDNQPDVDNVFDKL